MSDDNNNTDNSDSFLLFGDVTDFDLFKAQVQSLFVALSNEIQKRLDENKASLENIEKQFALLFAGYAEQAAVIENLILTTFTDNPEKEKIFRDNLAETRKQFLNLLKEGAQDVLASEDPNAASAIEDAVNEKLSD